MIPPSGPPQIRKMLDCSTAHLPPGFYVGDGENDVDVRAEEFEITGWFPWAYGAILWVPDDVAEMGHSDFAGDNHPAVIALRRWAREHGCDYILLDVDGPTYKGLEVYE